MSEPRISFCWWCSKPLAKGRDSQLAYAVVPFHDGEKIVHKQCKGDMHKQGFVRPITAQPGRTYGTR